jgi:hypothetical protein
MSHLCAILLGARVSAASASPAAASRPFQNRVPSRAGTALRRALLSMKQRLADPECQRVLSDFGVPDSTGVTVGEHIEALLFKDGSGQLLCSTPGVLAFTRVGGDTILVCAEQFARAVERDPTFAEIVLIHEVLHTLGVAENPPPSREITARVAERCGDWRARRP